VNALLMIKTSGKVSGPSKYTTMSI